MSHLCGLCLTLRDEAGQASRVLTGYDLMLLSVLVEAQTGRVETETAGPCPLRGMRPAQVVPLSAPGVRLAAAGSLLAASAGIEDKVHDGDLPRWTGPAAKRWGAAAASTGRQIASESGLDSDLLSRGVRRAAAAESAGGSLEDLLAPSGEVVAELFAHTATVAGREANREPLRKVGDAFGRLVHLLDAVDDYPDDVRHQRFNPLAATGTEPAQAHRTAVGLVNSIREALAGVEFADPGLATRLLGPVLDRAVSRSFGTVTDHQAQSCTPRLGPNTTVLAAVSTAVAATLGIFGRPRRRPPYYGDPYGPPPGYGGYGGYGGGYGYGRRGPSCCDLLACDCCANMACNDCCGGGGDDCCVCCC